MSSSKNASHEFTEEHNKLFEQLYIVLLAFIIALAAGGLIRIIDTLINLNTLQGGIILVLFVVSIIEIGIAVILYFPTDNIKNIYETEGSDIKELITAFKEFNMIFGVMIILTFILVVGYIITLLGGV